MFARDSALQPHKGISFMGPIKYTTRVATRAAKPHLIEARNDLRVGQMLRQFADLLDDRHRIAHCAADALGQIDGDIVTGAALPTDMQNDLPLAEQFLHRDASDKEP